MPTNTGTGTVNGSVPSVNVGREEAAVQRQSDPCAEIAARAAAHYAERVARAKDAVRVGEWVEMTTLTGDKEPVQVIAVKGMWATVCGDDDHAKCVDIGRLAAIWREK